MQHNMQHAMRYIYIYIHVCQRAAKKSIFIFGKAKISRDLRKLAALSSDEALNLIQTEWRCSWMHAYAGMCADMCAVMLGIIAAKVR